ncbi:MAG TPA: GNAT family N-acetyltransferase [Cyclobacteriaceae bacterium]|nr:GNAT family N-acetyltransferase [Cyclobacteriaceae bacterium]
MQIRAAKETDIPAIVDLLKLSLGESLMPKSETFWRWKHIDNPFGVSPVLLAFEDDQLIGVRAFMRWQWQQGDQLFSALRAVDTATHPQHQGKGIFKKLTMQLVEQCKAAGDHFIFNTPNQQSLPGYLKMGWINQGKLPLQLKWKIFPGLSKKESRQGDWEKLIDHRLLQLAASSSFIHTPLHHNYLCWRYRDNPQYTYELLLEDDFILIYRIKKHKYFKEWRITELLGDTQKALDALYAAMGDSMGLISASAAYPLRKSGFWKFKAGPSLSTRNLNMTGYPEKLSFTNWQPALGDMELF